MALKLVAVVWDDAHVAESEVLSVDEVATRTPARIVTYGILVRDDEQQIGVAAELYGEQSYRGVTFVPRSLVVEIISLGTWPRRARKPRAAETAA